MNNDILLEKVAKLPENMKSEVLNFVNFLLSKNTEAKEITDKPIFGSGKGMFVMKPDFDELIEDFKD